MRAVTQKTRPFYSSLQDALYYKSVPYIVCTFFQNKSVRGEKHHKRAPPPPGLQLDAPRSMQSVVDWMSTLLSLRCFHTWCNTDNGQRGVWGRIVPVDTIRSFLVASISGLKHWWKKLPRVTVQTEQRSRNTSGNQLLLTICCSDVINGAAQWLSELLRGPPLASGV